MRKVAARNGGTLEARQKGDPALPGAGRPPKSDILTEVGEMMEGDGYAEIEGDLLGEDGKPTGQMVKIRARIPNAKDAAKAWMAKVRKADPALLKLFLEYKYGKPKQQMDLTTNGQSLNNSPMANLSAEKQAEILRMINAESYGGASN